MLLKEVNEVFHVNVKCLRKFTDSVISYINLVNTETYFTKMSHFYAKKTDYK